MSVFRLDKAAHAIARAVATDSPDRQPAIAKRWCSELMAAFTSGTLRVVGVDDQLPIPPSRPGAIVAALTTGVITLAELNRWLASVGADVNITAEMLDARPKAKRISAKHPGVCAAARQMADAWANDRFRKKEQIPAVDSVATAIRQKLNDKFTQTWSVRTISRWCLKDWSFSVIEPTAQIAQGDGV